MSRTIHHTHKLKRHKYRSTGGAIFHCVLPDCYFKIEVRLSLGKRNICWRCGKDFSMNEYSIRLARPHCHNCTKSKTETKEAVVEKITEVAANDSLNSLKDRLKTMFSGGLAAVADDEKGEL